MHTVRLTDEEITMILLAIRAFDESEVEDDFDDPAEVCDNITEKLLSLRV